MNACWVWGVGEREDGGPKEREKMVWKCITSLRPPLREEGRVGKHFVVTNLPNRCTPNLPRRSHPLAGRSNRRCADGRYVSLPLCTRFCSKGKAGPDPLQTSKLPGALSVPPKNKSLPKPPEHKSPHPKGKAGPNLANTSKLPDALPWLPRNMPSHQTRSPSPKGTPKP